jgi:hypothetical protein
MPNGGKRYLGFGLNEDGDGAAIIGASLFCDPNPAKSGRVVGGASQEVR